MITKKNLKATDLMRSTVFQEIFAKPILIPVDTLIKIKTTENIVIEVDDIKEELH